MKEYVVYIQFVNQQGRFDEEAQAAVKQSISHYNTRSLIAKNPKQITDYRFSEDEQTLKIKLESKAELPMPTKALRLISEFLVKETNLNKYLSGRQLFKMTAENVSKDMSEAERPSSNNSTEREAFRVLEDKLVAIEDKLAAIYEVIMRRN